MRCKPYVSVFLLFCIAACQQSDFLIQVDTIVGSSLVGHVEGCELARIYYSSGNDATVDVNWMTSNAVLLFSTVSKSQFRIAFDVSKIAETSFFYLLAEDVLTGKRIITTYPVDKTLVGCNRNKLEISKVEDLHDSCADISVMYHGEGEIYALVVSSLDTLPSAEGVIYEGIYLGRHSNEEVKTIICGIYGQDPHNVVVTAVDGQCVHESAVFSFTPSFRIGIFSDPSFIRTYMRRRGRSGSNYSIRYRRYHEVASLPTAFSSLMVTEGGMLLNSTSDVRKVLTPVDEDGDAADTEYIDVEPGEYSVEWTQTAGNKGTFTGIAFVLGRGDLYVLITGPKETVTAFDVYHFGTHVGYFDFEAVDIVASGIEEGDHLFSVILKYGEQYFGPYSVLCYVLCVCLIPIRYDLGSTFI